MAHRGPNKLKLNLNKLDHLADVENITRPPPGLKKQCNIQIDSQEFEVTQRSLITLSRLGHGHYGRVEKVKLEGTDHVFAVKKIDIHTDSLDKSKIMNDLSISMKSGDCPFVITSYGALSHESEVWIIMELMDASLDKLCAKVNSEKKKFSESMLSLITYSTVNALEHLHGRNIIHRDVKPSNILADRRGRVKVCDFGISGNLTNSLANTNVGTQDYLAPERIKISSPEGFSIRSDVWSLGLTILELAMQKYPYPADKDFFKKLKRIVDEPAPTLPADSGYSENLKEFIDECLVKVAANRPTYLDLLQKDFLASVDLEKDTAEFAEFMNDIYQVNA